MAGESPIGATESSRLRRWNLGVGLIHAVQATVLLLIASDASLPVYASWIDGPPGSASLNDGEPLFDVPFAAATAAFLYLAAIDHLLVGGPLRSWYEMLSGVWELTGLVALFGVNAGMILCGMLMERGSRPGPDADWTPFWVGTLLGSVPWLVIAIQLIRGDEQAGVPGFVVGIFFSLLVLFALFAVNQALQYRQVGRWRDYLFGERAYIVLSLTAKSALAWQVYAGALAG
jgi:lipid-A-disaccharide synthase-like uncharacterized protein